MPGIDPRGPFFAQEPPTGEGRVAIVVAKEFGKGQIAGEDRAVV